MHYVLMIILIIGDNSVEARYDVVDQLYCKQVQADYRGSATHMVSCVERSASL